MGNQWKQWQTLFLGSKITADSDCSHEIKRHLLLGRKSLDKPRQHVKKQRHYSACLVKSVIFPVVIYGCESWTITKAEHRRIHAFWTVVLDKTFEIPLDSKEIKPVHPKGNQSWIFIGRTDAEGKALILWPPDAKSGFIWKDPDAGKDWRHEKGAAEDEMVRWHHRINEHEFEHVTRDGERQGSLEGCSPWGCKELDMT